MMNIPHYNKKLSYADYLSWPKDEQIKIIDGELHNMSPVSSTKHQQVSMNLSYWLMDFLEKRTVRSLQYHLMFDFSPKEKLMIRSTMLSGQIFL